MSLYSRPETAFWYYEFKIEGKRFRGSTKTANRTQAEAYEALQRLKALQAAKDSRAVIEGTVSQTTLWDAAQSWLAASGLGDRKGNFSRVRKLFGSEMQLVGDLWREAPSGRFALSKIVTVADVSPEVLKQLQAARSLEGNSPATINRELSLLRTLLVHAQTMAGVGPQMLKTTESPRQYSAKRRAFARMPQPRVESEDHPAFSNGERRALNALVSRLSGHFRTIVALEYEQVGTRGQICILKVSGGSRDVLELMVITLQDWGPAGFRAVIRKAQVTAIRVWKAVK